MIFVLFVVAAAFVAMLAVIGVLTFIAALNDSLEVIG